ncbi:hypothetical protein PPS11_32690 [Pseudomonas putida S11]|nr:hypothetical protein PPS11_32690 [Pseudomonas putida S11]
MKPETLELLVTRTMPFGKYQGRIIADLPGDYLAWFARKGFPAGGIGWVAGADARDRSQRAGRSACAVAAEARALTCSGLFAGTPAPTGTA